MLRTWSDQRKSQCGPPNVAPALHLIDFHEDMADGMGLEANSLSHQRQKLRYQAAPLLGRPGAR